MVMPGEARGEDIATRVAYRRIETTVDALFVYRSRDMYTSN